MIAPVLLSFILGSKIVPHAQKMMSAVERFVPSSALAHSVPCKRNPIRPRERPRQHS